MNTNALITHEQALRTLAVELRRHASELRASRPQLYSIDQLAERYAVGIDRLKGLLRESGLAAGGPIDRRTWRLHIDQLDELDEYMRGVFAGEAVRA